MSEPMNNNVLHSVIREIDDEIKARKIVREQLLLSYCETHGIVNGCRVLRDGKEFQVVINQGNKPA